MTHDEWRLLRYGLLTAFLMGIVLVPILVHDKNFPRSAAEGILGSYRFSRLSAVQVPGTAQEIKLALCVKCPLPDSDYTN